MKRVLVLLVALFVVGGVFWRFPLFHVVRTSELAAARQLADFDAAKFARTFWDDKFMPIFSQAHEFRTVLNALHTDPHAAQVKYGRKVGVGRSTLFLLRGEGRIVSVEKGGIGISQSEGERDVELLLQTGPLFGNTARDVSGLLNAGDFGNSQDFNNISSELNQIVEREAIEPLKNSVAVGQKIAFVGGAEIRDGAENSRPIKIVPLRTSAADHQTGGTP